MYEKESLVAEAKLKAERKVKNGPALPNLCGRPSEAGARSRNPEPGFQVKDLENLVRPERFELPTHCSGGCPLDDGQRKIKQLQSLTGGGVLHYRR